MTGGGQRSQVSLRYAPDALLWLHSRPALHIPQGAMRELPWLSMPAATRRVPMSERDRETPSEPREMPYRRTWGPGEAWRSGVHGVV